jgi:Polyketide cyclase / dehydrase and lipid transport
MQTGGTMRTGKKIAIAAAAAVVVGVAWFGSARLSGRATGYRDTDCKVTTGRTPEGVLEAWAHCEWALPAERVESVLDVLGDQDRYFSGVSESTVLRTDGDRTWVRQVQHASGISDREVVLEFTTEAIPNGRRYRWHKAADQSGRHPGNVECEVHEGHWQIVSDGDKTDVEYHLRYLPGGSVPTFLVSAFLDSGVAGALADLHQAAGAQLVASRDAGGAS